MNLYNIIGTKKVNYAFVIIGAVIYGLALGLIISPNRLAPGGAAGLSVMLSSFLPLGVGTLTMLCNLPLLLYAVWVFGWRFLLGTILAIAVSGVTADFCSVFLPLTENPFLAAIFGGAVMGAGCGLVFLSGATTGGTDIVTKLVKRKKPYVSTGQIFMAVDGVICILSGFVFGSLEKSLYAFVCLFVFSRVLDRLLYGGTAAKMVMIISRHSEEILPVLLKNARVGCTVLKGRSGYVGKETEVLICAMRKQSLPNVRKLVLEADEKAFMLVGDTNEVYGEGFLKSPSEY